jgi:hypothetical protein
MKYKIDCIRGVRSALAPPGDVPGDRRGESTETGKLAAAYFQGLDSRRQTMQARCERATLDMQPYLVSKRIDLDDLNTDSSSVVAAERQSLVEKGEALSAWIDHVAAMLGGGEATDAGDEAADDRADDRSVNRSLTLRVKRVHCKDETGSGTGEWGKDRINMAAVLIDTSGASIVVPEFGAGQYDDGNVKTLNRDLHTYKLDLDYTPAKAFTALIMFVEKDDGGFAEFVRKMYNAIKKDLHKYLISICTAAGVALGASVGGTIGTLAGPLGTVIGAVAGALVGAIVGWLINVFQDDIFTPQSVLLALNSPRASFKGSLVSPEQRLRFKGHHGEYAVYCVWQLERK